MTSSGTVSGITWLTTSTAANSSNPAIALDSSNTAHIVFQSLIYNATYTNIAYLTVTSSGTVSAITWLTTSTTANSQAVAIALDSSNTAHVVFESLIYNASYWNIAYLTVTSSGTVSAITWLTTSTAASSFNPTIAMDSNGIVHVLCQSYIYNSAYYNIIYVTVDASGQISPLREVTASSSISYQVPAITTYNNMPYAAWTGSDGSIQTAQIPVGEFVYDAGTLVTGNSLVLDSNGQNQQFFGSAVVDSTGTAHVVFVSDSYSAGINNILYATITPQGATAITWLTTSTAANSSNPAIALDSSNTAHIVFQSLIYNATYTNIAYLTVTSSGTVSAITWLTTSTTANSYNPAIALDSSNTAHIVFQSLIYNATYYNIAYLTVTSSGTVSGITWLTTSTAANSSNPTIALDSSDTAHVVFQSYIYNAITTGNNCSNVAYITIASGGTVSPLQWLTNIGAHPQYALGITSFALGFNATIGGMQVVWFDQTLAYNVAFSTIIGNSLQSYAATTTPNTSSLFVSTDTILTSAISAATLWLNRTPVTTTTLSAATPSGTTDLPLTNSTGFGAGDTLEVIAGTTYDRGIVSIVSGSTVTLTNGLINAFPSGGTVNRVDFLPDISIVSAGTSDVFNALAWQQTSILSGTVLEDTYTYTTNTPGEQVALEIQCSRVNTATHPLCNGYGLGLGIG